MWPDPTETRALLEHAAGEDRSAVDRLLASHREPLRRMIAVRLDRSLGRREDASDVVQGVLLEASRRLAEYLRHPPMPFQLWLRQIARDQLIDVHRRHRVAGRRSIDRERSLTAKEFSDRSSLDLASVYAIRVRRRPLWRFAASWSIGFTPPSTGSAKTTARSSSCDTSSTSRIQKSPRPWD